MNTPNPTLDTGTGCLYLVPTPLDFGCAPEFQSPITNALPAQTLQVASRLSHWITESAKSTRAFLKRVDTHAPLSQPLQALNVVELPREVHKKGDHARSRAATFDARPLLAPALAGHDMGLVSEAGMPAVADPGSSVVRAAHNLGIEVQVLAGPVSLMMALAASGLDVTELERLPLRRLSRMAITSRYPMDATPPSALFDRDETDQALDTAAAVIRLLRACDQS